MATTDYIVFEGQSALEIRLDTEIDISNAQQIKIGYEKPDGTSDYWTATAYDTTTIRYAFTEPSELDQDGIWKFWSYAKFSDGRIAYGQVVTQRVSAVGETL